MHYPQKQNVTTSMVELKKMLAYAKISPKMVNPRDVAGNVEEGHPTSIILPSMLQWVMNSAAQNINDPKHDNDNRISRAPFHVKCAQLR